jgi:integrase/recombinase XerC
MSYVDSVRKPPSTLTADEQTALLRVTGEHKAGFRDHVIFSFALGTALRMHEIAALRVGEIRNEKGDIRRRFPLRVFKRSNLDFKTQEVVMPDDLRYKLEKFLRWKKSEGEPLGDADPLFYSRQGTHVLTRQRLHQIFNHWQEKAGFERHMHFHCLRHTALSNLYRRTKDIRLVQKIARHKSLLSTQIYTAPSDEDVLAGVRGLRC